MGPAPLADRETQETVDQAETFNAARRRKEVALASLREAELQRLQGRYALVSEVEFAIAQEVTRCKSHLLAIPTRLREAAPHLTPADIQTVEEVIRQALVDLANGVATVPETARKVAMQ